MEAPSTTDDQGLPVRPRPDGGDIRKVTEQDVGRIADVLAQAFYDDPAFSWMFPDDSRRIRQNRGLFAYFLRRVWLGPDLCYTTDRFAGACLWMPPGTWHLSPFRQLLMLPAVLRIARGAIGRMTGYMNEMERNHPHEEHYYLPVVGVAPAWQGKGFGSALMKPILDRCDDEGVPAYLEASSTRSRALYERHGFKATGELTVKDSPPLWPMWREPNA